MDSRDALAGGLSSSQFIVDGYLGDLTDAELLTRPVPGSNHIAWQLGHLIAAEHQMIEAVRPGSMPKLPADFAEKHGKGTAGSDNPKDFLTKDQYLKLAKEQRTGTLAVLKSLGDADLDQPAPEAMRNFVPTVGALMTMQATHWMMHAGQWAIVRRKLGRKPLF